MYGAVMTAGIRCSLAVAAVLAACGGKSKATCKADVDDLMTYLRSIDQPYSVVSVGDGVHLVERGSAAAATHFAPVLTLEMSLISFEGRVVGPEDLANELEDTHRKVAAAIAAGEGGRRDSQDPAMLYLAIDSAERWDRVVAVADAVRAAGFTHAKLVFARPIGGGPPPRTWVEDKFAAASSRGSELDPGKLAMQVADTTRDIIKGCSALEKVYGAVASEEGDKATEIIEGTGPALIECNCAADLPALRSIMWMVLGERPQTGIASVELSATGKAVALPKAATWKDGAAQLVDGAVVTFVVR
jgi:hypothetical protein